MTSKGCGPKANQGSLLRSTVLQVLFPCCGRLFLLVDDSFIDNSILPVVSVKLHFTSHPPQDKTLRSETYRADLNAQCFGRGGGCRGSDLSGIIPAIAQKSILREFQRSLASA